jgi:hypothetical protein
MESVPSNRKGRVTAIRDPKTSPEMLREIFAFDQHSNVTRELARREDCPEDLLLSLYKLSTKEDNERIDILYDLSWRKRMSTHVAEVIASDLRVPQIPGMFASRNLLSEAFIINCLRTRPETRRSFYVGPTTNSVMIRDELYKLLLTDKSKENLESFKRHYQLTPDEETELSETYKGEALSEEERKARFLEAWNVAIEKHEAQLRRFYTGDIVDFISGFQRAYSYMPWHVDNFGWETWTFERIMDEMDVVEGIRAEFYGFSRKVSTEVLLQAVQDDYFYPCFYIANRSELDPECARALFAEEHPFLRFAVARNLSSPPDVVAEALKDPHPTVRVGFAQRSIMHPRDLATILRDPVPAVAQMIFNEDRLHLSFNSMLKLEGGSEEDYLDLLTAVSPKSLHRMAEIVARSHNPSALPALRILAKSEDGATRVSTVRGLAHGDFGNQIEDDVWIGWAGDKLSQIRTYVVKRLIGYETRQVDFLRLLREQNLSGLQKSVLMAGLTDRKEYRAALELNDDDINLGAYVNWKASIEEYEGIEFRDRTYLERAREIRSVRDRVSSEVREDWYPNYEVLDESQAQWIGTASREIQDWFWGGEYPEKLFDDEPSEE